MRVIRNSKPDKVRLAAGALAGLLASASALAGSATWDFTTDPTTGTNPIEVYQSGFLDSSGSSVYWKAAGGNPGGFLGVTWPLGSSSSIAVFPDIDSGKIVSSFTFECDLRIGNPQQNERAADGFSLNFARSSDDVFVNHTSSDFATSGAVETGTKTGLAISFDTWSGNALPDGADIEGIIVRVDNVTVLRQAMPTRNGACDDITSLQTGPRDLPYWTAATAAGTMPDAAFEPASWAGLCWQKLAVELDDQSKLTITWKGNKILDKFQTTFFPSAGGLVLAGRTGGADEHTHFDNIKLTTVALTSDTTPPTVPTDLIATTIGAYRAVLQWGASTDNSGRVAYEIEQNGTALPGTIVATNADIRNLSPNTSYTFKVRALDVSLNKSAQVSLTIKTVADVDDPNYAIAKVYGPPGDPISGTAVDALLGDSRYPASPDRTMRLAAMWMSYGEPLFGDTYGDNLGVRIAGTVTPTETADYRFFVRSDDASQLYLNTTGATVPDADGLSQIAEETGCCNAFTEPAADHATMLRTSDPVSLTAGRTYGVLFLVKEGGGGDWGQVAWRKEGDTTPATSLVPIGPPYFKSEGTAKSDPVGAEITITKDPVDTTVIANEPTSFTGAATFKSPYTTTALYQWYKNGAVIPGANAATYNIKVANLADNGAKIKLMVAVPGLQVFSKEVTLTVTTDNKPASIVKVSGSDKFTVATVIFSEPVKDASALAAGNYAMNNGLTVSSVARVDDYTVRLTTSKQALDTLYTLTVTGVKDAAGNLSNTSYEWRSYALLTGYMGFASWDNIGTTAVTALTDDPRYPDSPTFTATTTRFDTRPVYGDDSHDNYGGRLQGFLTPTESASYRFFIHSDDSSELWLSTDDTEANLAKIAEETGCCNGYTEPDSPRTSEPIALVAGKKYFVRGIYKEGGGGDYMDVGWRKEGDTTAAGALSPIAGSFLSWYVDPFAGPPLIKTAPADVAVAAGGTATLSIEIGLGERPLSYQWRKASKPIDGATGASLVLNNASATDAASYDVIVSNAAGSVTSGAVGLVLNGSFLIEAEDFNYDSGQTKAVASTMPYLGGAYDGLSAVAKVDYDSTDGNDSDVYRKGETPNKNINENLGGQLGKWRGTWDVTSNYKLGWTDTGDWCNYTRTFPAGNYAVVAALSYDGRGASQLKGTLAQVTAGATTANQTLVPLGKFDAPGSGGWGKNNLVPMVDDAGAPALVQLSGEQTVRFTMDSGDFDYLLFVPAGAVVQKPQFSSIKANTDGTITIVWTGGGTLQAAASLTAPVVWQDVTGATSPYTFKPTATQLFGRIKQ